MQINASGQSDLLGQHQHAYSMRFVSGKGFVHGAMNVDGHVHISGQDLQGGEAFHEDINHDHVRTMFNRSLGPIQDLVGSCSDIDGIEGPLVRLLLQLFKSIHQRFRSRNHGGKALIRQGFVILYQIQAASNGRSGPRQRSLPDTSPPWA